MVARGHYCRFRVRSSDWLSINQTSKSVFLAGQDLRSVGFEAYLFHVAYIREGENECYKPTVRRDACLHVVVQWENEKLATIKLLVKRKDV